MAKKGHWFCDHCDDVVYMSYEATSQKNVSCPRCGYLACNFVPGTISRRILPEEWFARMREAAGVLATPEIPTQVHAKKLL